MPINQLVLPYPDFQNLQVIDPDKFDANYSAIVAKCDEISAFSNTVDLSLYYSKLQADNLFANKANVTNTVTTDTNQTINGIKTFGFIVNVPTPDFPTSAVPKSYVDNAITNAFAGIAQDNTILDVKLSNDPSQIKFRVAVMEQDYLSKNGDVFYGGMNCNNQEFRKPLLRDYTEDVATSATATGTFNIDFSLANVFNLTLTGNTTLTFSNIPATKCHSATLFIRQGTTAYSLTFPASVKFSGDVIPVISDVNKTSIFSLVTVNGGTRYYASASTKFTT